MKGTLSTSDVARILGVAAGSVANWIDQGQLKAGRTPGGHRRVLRDDLRGFLRQQNLPIPEELAQSKPLPLVLVVDDEVSVAKWLALEISSAEPTWQVQQAHDGFAAGQMVGTYRPHVVILDLRMPDLDGFEVCRRIKSDPVTRDTAVIAITAYPSAGAEQRILECGAQICLIKPLEIDTVLQEVRRALKNKVSGRVPASAGRRD